MAAGEVIDHGHIKTAIQQVAGGDGADVPGAPGYQDFRHVSHSTIEGCESAAASLRVESRESRCSVPPQRGRLVVDRQIIERRIYAPGSVLPPREVLHRHGIRPVSVKRRPNGTVYSIPFASIEARVKAWDRFNADEEWCALRDAGTVALQGVRIYPAGKIFEISL